MTRWARGGNMQVTHFNVACIERHFLLITDHIELQWFYNVMEPEGQMKRWLEYLSGFDFEVVHS